MITWWQALLLGLVQGLTEFIPVSSSAHLNITHWLLGGKERYLTFDVLLHIGTLAALAFYFRHDWAELLRNPKQRGLRNLVFAACVPAVIAGLSLRHLEDQDPFKQVWFNAILLIVAGLVMGYADKVGRKQREVESVTLRDALWIGGSQALALMPGVSRSGSTITMGLFRGFTREAAARFSFLMSLPITAGATLFELYHAVKEGAVKTINATPATMLLGIVVSGVSGFWAIGFLLNYLKTRDVTLFVAWRIVVALFVLAVWFLRGRG